MACERTRLILVATGAGVLVAGVAAAEPASPEPVRRAFDTKPFVDPAPRRAGAMSFALSDRLEVVVSGGKAKSLGESQGRRAEGPAGRSPPRSVARVGVLLRW